MWTGFLQTLEDAQAFTPGEEEEEAFQLEEETAMDCFQTSISKARDLADQLLAPKAVLHGLSDFRMETTAIQESLDENPGSSQNNSLQALRNLFSSLKAQWQGANLPKDHSLKRELDSCVKVLATLGAEVAAAMDKSVLSALQLQHHHPNEYTILPNQTSLPLMSPPSREALWSGALSGPLSRPP